jgi:hypothetical protein
MRLPAGGLHQFLCSYSARPLQQIQNLCGLTAVPGGSGLFLALERFRRGAGLLGRLGLLRRNVGTLSRNAGLFVRFRLVARRCGVGGAGFFCDRCIHFVFSFGGDYRGHDMDHSAAPEKQVNSVGNAEGDETAMGAGHHPQLAAGGI